MKVGRKHFKLGVMAAAAIGMLVVAQPTIAGATDDPNHVTAGAGTPKVLLSVGPVPVGAITVPVIFEVCVGAECVSNELGDTAASLKLLVSAPPHSNAVAAGGDPDPCPKTESGEDLLGSVLHFSVTGGTAGAEVSGSLTKSDGTPLLSLPPISVPADSKTQPGTVRLCALSPV